MWQRGQSAAPTSLHQGRVHLARGIEQLTHSVPGMCSPTYSWGCAWLALFETRNMHRWGLNIPEALLAIHQSSPTMISLQNLHYDWQLQPESSMCRSQDRCMSRFDGRSRTSTYDCGMSTTPRPISGA
jgi:hypothetical protein